MNHKSLKINILILIFILLLILILILIFYKILLIFREIFLNFAKVILTFLFMKTSKFIIGALGIVLTLGVAQSCGKKGESLADAVSQVANATGSDLLTNTEELQKAEDALKELPKFKGKDVQVFQNVQFYGGTMPRIEIELIDPEKPENVDHYTYQGGKWSEPQPVQISGGGDLKDNSTPLNDIKFATVAIVYKNWKEKAATVEGAEKAELDYIYFNLWVPTQKRYWDANTIEGTREKYNINFNLDGSVREFKKR